MILLTILAIVALTALSILPILQPLYESMLFQILLRTVLSGLILFFTFIKAPPMPWFTKGTLVLAVLLLWYPFVIDSQRILLLLELFTVYALFAALIYHELFQRRGITVLVTVTVILAMCSMADMGAYAYIGTKVFPFWQVGAAIAVLFGMIYGWLEYTGRTALKVRKLSCYILNIFIAMFLGFYVGWNAACHLNYALDTGTPIKQSFEIVDAEIDGGYRKLTEFIFVVQVDGQDMELQVSESDFYAHDIGDNIEVTLYNGFFHEPFYIAE